MHKFKIICSSRSDVILMMSVLHALKFKKIKELFTADADITAMCNSNIKSDFEQLARNDKFAKYISQYSFDTRNNNYYKNKKLILSCLFIFMFILLITIILNLFMYDFIFISLIFIFVAYLMHCIIMHDVKTF